MSKIRNWSIVAAVGIGLAVASQSQAAVDAYLVIDGGTPTTPIAVNPGINVLTWSWGASNTGVVSIQGPSSGTGLLFDAGTAGAITMTSTAPGAQTLAITETGLMSSGPLTFMSSFTGPLFNPGDTLTRTFMITPAGGSPIMLGSVSGDTTMGQTFWTNASFTGSYSITESIVFDALKSGDSFSIDDSVRTPVPEPATLGLLALGFAGVGFVRRRRQS
jgi:hypothetical protein